MYGHRRRWTITELEEMWASACKHYNEVGERLHKLDILIPALKKERRKLRSAYRYARKEVRDCSDALYNAKNHRDTMEIINRCLSECK